ncbi:MULTISPECIES: type II toxin-antitoxin system Phd/YefM family antitoxin [unclassified Thioalkalivibrio]|nr:MULTISPECIES: type II toxin-antitoxin system Phd/YefM family antitoxin [unclassified Thioalkalivibrio]
MKEIDVRDAREQLSSILKEVERGEEVCILRRGRPVARVVQPAGDPPRFRSRADLRQSLPAMRETAVDTVRTVRDTERY